MKQNFPISELNHFTIIGKGTVLNGDLQAETGLRLEGTIKGTVTTSGELVVLSSGIIEGEVTSRSSVIAGKVKGNLTATEKLVLEAGSSLYGDIKTKSLVISEGAYLHGNCSMDDPYTE